MKTYTHKKTGIKVSLHEYCDGLKFYENAESEIQLIPELVEDSLDWEELQKPEFEVIRYKDGAGKEYYRKHNGKFTINLQYEYDINLQYDYEEDDLIKGKELRIHAIKRLSDGMRFSVGDKVLWDSPSFKFKDHYNNFMKIESIDFSCGDYVFNKIWSTIGINRICNLRHYEEEPVYRSLDGCNIYEYDEFHVVNKETFEVLKDCKYPTIKVTDPNKWEIFKFKSNMEEYIWLNKPCLSINDVAKVYITANRKYSKRLSGWEIEAEQLIDIVKDKLKS
ncbi:MAG: hypothetical protein ACOC22_01200 [bacterium]